VAGTLDDAHMQESVARTVSQRDKAKALLRVVPLDHSMDGWAGGAVELRTARWRISEIAGWWLVVVVVEPAAAARAISIVHVTSWSAKINQTVGSAGAVVNVCRERCFRLSVDQHRHYLRARCSIRCLTNDIPALSVPAA
jgi:hypothetical protein